jgi:hypothetical protein
MFGENTLRALTPPEDTKDSIVGSLRKTPRLFDVTSIQAQSDYLVNNRAIPFCDPTCLLWQVNGLVGIGSQNWIDSYTRHLNQALGRQLATEPLPVYPPTGGPLGERLEANHHALLFHPKTGQCVTDAVMAPRMARWCKPENALSN